MSKEHGDEQNVVPLHIIDQWPTNWNSYHPVYPDATSTGLLHNSMPACNYEHAYVPPWRVTAISLLSLMQDDVKSSAAVA